MLSQIWMARLLYFFLMLLWGSNSWWWRLLWYWAFFPLEEWKFSIWPGRVAWSWALNCFCYPCSVTGEKSASAHLGLLSVNQPESGQWCKYCRPRHPRWFDDESVTVDGILMDSSRHVFIKTRLQSEDVKLLFEGWLTTTELLVFSR